MKKREWDKDFLSIKAWTVKNNVPLLILGCIILIPVTYAIVSLILRLVSDVNEVFSWNLSIENKFDFVTPALYYFSSIAQTMGAIIGLALAAMYAIMPNIRSSKDNPAFEPARRLLQRDEYFRRSINVGSVCILVSIVGLLFIYVTASSQSWAFVLLLFLGVTALGLGVYSLGTMFYFIRVRMPKYFSPVEILEFAFCKSDNDICVYNLKDAIDYMEICILLECNGIFNENTKRSLAIINKPITSSTNKAVTERYYTTCLKLLFNNIEKDLEHSYISLSSKNEYICKSLISIWESMKLNFYNLNRSYEDIQYDKISLVIDFFINYIKQHKPMPNEVGNTLIEDLVLSAKYEPIIQFLPDEIIDQLIDLYWSIIDTSKFVTPMNELLTYYLCDEPSEKWVNKLISIYNSFIDEIIVCLFMKTNFKEYYNKVMYIDSLFEEMNRKDNRLSEKEDFHLFNTVLGINTKQITWKNIQIYFKKRYYSTNDLYDLKSITNIEIIYVISKLKYHSKIKNFTNFVYFHFIPYLERHGINVYDNPEYLAIIRKRIKDIKEPELDF